MNIVYNEHVETVDVPIKPSDRLKARDMLGKYHKLFTDKQEILGDVPIFINIGEWNEEDEELDNEVNKVADEHPTRPVFVDDVLLED